MFWCDFTPISIEIRLKWLALLWKKIVWAFRKSTGKVEYLIPSLRKSHLKYSVFCKILQKMTKFVVPKLRLWDYVWPWEAQIWTLIVCIVQLARLKIAFQIFVVRVKFQSWIKTWKMRKNAKIARISIFLQFCGNFQSRYLRCYWLKINENPAR